MDGGDDEGSMVSLTPGLFVVDWVIHGVYLVDVYHRMTSRELRRVEGESRKRDKRETSPTTTWTSPRIYLVLSLRRQLAG